MMHRSTLGLSLVVGLAGLSGSAWSQTFKDQLIGTWNLVSVTEDYGGGKVLKDPFGPNPGGGITFSPNGRMMFMIIGADLPTKPTKPQESWRLVVAYYGTYTVNEADHTVSLHPEKATIPAFDRSTRIVHFTINGDELIEKGIHPIKGPTGPFTPTEVYKRAT